MMRINRLLAVVTIFLLAVGCSNVHSVFLRDRMNCKSLFQDMADFKRAYLNIAIGDPTVQNQADQIVTLIMNDKGNVYDFVYCLLTLNEVERAASKTINSKGRGRLQASITIMEAFYCRLKGKEQITLVDLEDSILDDYRDIKNSSIENFLAVYKKINGAQIAANPQPLEGHSQQPQQQQQQQPQQQQQQQPKQQQQQPKQQQQQPKQQQQQPKQQQQSGWILGSTLFKVSGIVAIGAVIAGVAYWYFSSDKRSNAAAHDNK